MRRTSICGAAETLLIDKRCLKTHCRPILDQLSQLGCKIIGDNIIKKFVSGKMKIATKKDWETEYLSPIISVKSVNDINQAIDHIEWRISQLNDKGLDGFNKLVALKDLEEIKKLVDKAIENAPHFTVSKDFFDK